VSQVSGAHLRGCAPGLTHQGCNDGESLATYCCAGDCSNP